MIKIKLLIATLFISICGFTQIGVNLSKNKNDSTYTYYKVSLYNEVGLELDNSDFNVFEIDVYSPPFDSLVIPGFYFIVTYTKYETRVYKYKTII